MNTFSKWTEIDLNKCEHFLKANWDPSKLDQACEWAHRWRVYYSAIFFCLKSATTNSLYSRPRFGSAVVLEMCCAETDASLQTTGMSRTDIVAIETHNRTLAAVKNAASPKYSCIYLISQRLGRLTQFAGSSGAQKFSKFPKKLARTKTTINICIKMKLNVKLQLSYESCILRVSWLDFDVYLLGYVRWSPEG